MLDEDPAPPPPKKMGAQSQFLAHVFCGQTTGWIKKPLGKEVGLGPSDIVLNRGAISLLKGGIAPTFRPMSIVAKRSPVSATAEHLLF